MSNRDRPPRAIDIVEYWDQQPLIELKDGYWNPMRDVGEPACQACGCWSPEWDIGELTDNYEENRPLINERWERSGLEKAHIVPHSLGGANSPSNFFMLCRSCHFSFDSEIVTTNRKKMLKIYTWLRKRPMETAKIVKQITDRFSRQNKIPDEEVVRAMHMKRIVDDIFDENQKVQLEIKEEERAKKYNYKAKNLEEITEIVLDECVAIAEIAREDQMRLDLDLFEWANHTKELTNE